MDWGEVMLVLRIRLLWSWFDFGDLMDVMGWCLEFEVPLEVPQRLGNCFRRCQVLVLVVLA